MLVIKRDSTCIVKQGVIIILRQEIYNIVNNLIGYLSLKEIKHYI